MMVLAGIIIHGKMLDDFRLKDIWKNKYLDNGKKEV